MNFKNYLGQKDLMYLLGFKYKMQLKRLLDKNPNIFIIRYVCSRPFYLRESVDEYMDGVIREANDPDLRWDYEARKLKITYFDVSLKEWLPRCMVLEHFPYAADKLYDAANVVIRTRQLYNQMFFSVSSVIRYIGLGTDLDEETKRKAIRGLRNAWKLKEQSED